MPADGPKGLRVSNTHALTIGLILLLLATFVIGVGFLIWRGYGETLDRTSQQATSSSQVVAANAEWILQTAR